MLETPDLRFFGRSEQLHLAYHAVFEFQAAYQRLPGNSADDNAKIIEIVKKINESNKSSEGISVDEIDEAVIKNVAQFSAA